MSFLSGFIAIIGPPNVGKSTLLNHILGLKVSIVSPKPQTTRNRIVGIYHGDGFQMVFMDTPGIHTTKTPLHKSMVGSALATIQEVDVLLFLIDAQKPDDPHISQVIQKIESKPCILAINKIDKAPREELLPIIDKYAQMHRFDALVPVSALTGDGVEDLLNEIKSRLRPGPPFFPEDMQTDQTESFLVSEIIREKIYLNVKQELPYCSAVTVEEMEEGKKDLLTITANIHVESDSQKGILIGKGGRMIKSIGASARKEIEKIFGMQVYLDLRVRVEKNWSKDTRALKRLGY
ncbi:membrane-associated, 16S rRNA-binding GTPase [uncultured Desulfobacterium sp.]|uniref:GTPase Era n=1 Tax=uncultured Desulfobacterium sp. TaxID=201089 RepID=A0A445N1F0_9BACT|nr:membrane-associated, 16S rRNA-binding GTPase [uncultured Desulfobacterium sp.]